MKIKIIFHGSLKKYNNNREEMELEIPDGMMVGELIPKINVPGEEIAFVAVNGSRAPVSQMLHDGAEVKLFQLVGGG
jgi:sulfur carrier protein ThiS